MGNWNGKVPLVPGDDILILGAQPITQNNFSVSPSPLDLDFGTLDFGTYPNGSKESLKDLKKIVKTALREKLNESQS